MIRIDDNYHIETEQNGQCTLVFKEIRDNKKGNPTEYKDYWYLSNIKSCLLRYFELRQEEAQSIKELYSRIEEVENLIKMLEFRVEQNWGDGTKCWLYFSVPLDSSLEHIKDVAKEKVLQEWERIQSGIYHFSPPESCRPTIKIEEFKDNKVVNRGIKLKTKWR